MTPFKRNERNTGTVVKRGRATMQSTVTDPPRGKRTLGSLRHAGLVAVASVTGSVGCLLVWGR